MTSNTHQKLVDSLVKALIEQGYVIDSADSGSYPKPDAIGRHEPDIIGHTPAGIVVIGEAKTSDDLGNPTTKEQLIDFSNRIMSTGLLRGRPVPFHIIVEKDSIEELKSVLYSLGLQNKIGNIITIWHL